MPAIEESVPPSSDGAVAARGRRLFWLTAVVAVLVVIIDQATKWWAEAALSDGRTVPFIGDLIRFQLVYNSGAALSIGTGATWVFTVIAAVAVVVIAWFAWRIRSKWWALTLGLLLGGALTHLGDRLFRPPAFARGHVVDFIAYANFFIGNVADIAIVLGAVAIVLMTLFGVRTGRSPLPADTGASD